MSKKIKAAVSALLALSVAASFLSACSSDKPVHTHSIYTMPAKAATCTEEGNVEYDYCLYCGQCYLNGEEVEASEVVLPVDGNNHTAKTEYDKVLPTCTSTGVKAYWYCADCDTYCIDGVEMNGKESGEEAIASALSIEADPSAHSLVSVARTEPTCVVDGMLEHTQCEYCGALFNAEGTQAATVEQLAIPATGEHDFGADDGDFCLLCDAYKLYYDETAPEKYAVIDAACKYDFKAASAGAMHGTDAESRSAAVKAVLEERMSASTQYGSGATVECVNGEWIVANTKDSLVGSFTRFAVDDGEGNPYKGKLILTFDVGISQAAEIGRLGIKVVREYNETEGDPSTEAVDPVEGGVFSKLIGTNSAEENNPDRVLEPGVVYRMQYLVETTDEDQMVQLFTHMGATTVTISNLHMLPLKDEAPTGTVSATLLSFGEANGAASSAEVFGGNDFFDAQAWETFAGEPCTAEQLYDRAGNLSFTQATAARFPLFYVAQSADGAFTHIGDKGEKTDLADEIYGRTYTYTFTVSSTGEFDLLLLGANGSLSPKAESGSGIYLNFAADGKVTVYHGCAAGSAYYSWGEFSGASSFKMNAQNSVSVTLVRLSGSELTVALSVNGQKVAFAAESVANADKFSATEDGAFKTSGVLSKTGFGQRVGISPAEGSTVTVSGIELPGSGYFAAVSVTDGKINGQSSLYAEIGSEVTAVADEKEGYNFAGWSNGTETVSAEKEYTFEVTGPVALTAQYQTSAGVKSYTIINGKDFFDVANWTAVGEAGVTKDADTNLVFTAATASRFDLFHVAQMTDGTWVHFADNGEDKTENVKDIYGKKYSYTFDVSASGAFDMLVIGPSGATDPSNKTSNGAWLNFAADGKVTFNFANSQAGKQCWGELSGSSTFVFGADKVNEVTVTFVRSDMDTLSIELSVNGQKVAFAGESITNADKFSVSEGTITVAGIFATQGYGQRTGFFPSADCTVVLSGLEIAIDGAPIQQ